MPLPDEIYVEWDAGSVAMKVTDLGIPMTIFGETHERFPTEMLMKLLGSVAGQAYHFTFYDADQERRGFLIKSITEPTNLTIYALRHYGEFEEFQLCEEPAPRTSPMHGDVRFTLIRQPIVSPESPQSDPEAQPPSQTQD